MAITSSLSLSLNSGDGTATLSKSVPGLTYTGINEMYITPQVIGVAPPLQPQPTALMNAPGTITPTVSAGGNLAAGTYYYKVTALNAVGETVGSPEASATTITSNSAVALAWTAVTGATSYKIYRGTAAAGENTYYTSGTNSYTDTGAAGTAGSVPGSNTTQVSAPGTVTPTGSGTGGTLAAATYYYKVTALNAVGETTGSAEANVTTSGTTSSVALAWAAVTGAATYRIYRGTTPGGESVYYTSGTNSYTDTNAASTGGTVPVSNTTQVSAPGTVTPTAQVGGTLAAATYYFKVTALNAAGETTGSAEANGTTSGTTSAISLAWTAIPGASGYKVYRGTSTGAESIYYATSTNSFLDVGAAGNPGTVPGANSTGPTGSMTSGNYLVKITYVNAPQGESLPSPESATVPVISSGSLTVKSPAAAPPAASYNVYITASGGSTGTETKQNSSPIAVGTDYVQTAAVSAGASLPVTDTTLTWTATLPQVPVQVAYLRNLTSAALVPPAAPTLQQAGGGSITGTTYYVKITYTAAAGETLASGESSLSVLANNLLQVNSPTATAGATGYNVYVSTGSGTETKQNASPIALGISWIEPVSGLVTGASVPSGNTTGASATVTWTPNGGSANKVIDLVPQAAIVFLEPTAGAGKGGITAVSITVSTDQTPIEAFFAG